METESKENLLATLEAILFVSGEPCESKEIAVALEIPVEEVESGIKKLGEELKASRAGISVLKSEDRYQLITVPEVKDAVEKFVKHGMREQLSPAAAETLAIVAYRGPINKAGVEAIRGVNSAFTLRLLAIRGLIEKYPSSTDSRIYLYRVTPDFLSYLGVTKIEELPEYEKISKNESMTKLQSEASGLDSKE